jgi:ferrochelatase
LASNFPDASTPAGGVGIVLINLGTPAGPDPGSVRRFLREFLTDRRVIELSPALWRPCLELCVLPWRGRTAAAKYASIWYPEGSPIAVHTAAQADALATVLGAAAPGGTAFAVRHAMRYGEPSVGAVLDALARDGIGRVLIAPMYPQYSQTTVATVYDAVAYHIEKRRDLPELRFVRSFPTEPLYIEALARQVEAVWESEGRPDFEAGHRLLLSFHGITISMVQGGDPYPIECAATAAALRERLGVTEEAAPLTYQSRFGRTPWLTPATISRVTALGAEGCERIDVLCPGFAADCLETLEEIDQLNREAFYKAGGGRFVRIPCVNEHPVFIDALAHLVRTHTQGW